MVNGAEMCAPVNKFLSRKDFQEFKNVMQHDILFALH